MTLARKVHPDKWNNHKDATKAFQKVANAYATLSDEQKKFMYDLSLTSNKFNNNNNNNTSNSNGQSYSYTFTSNNVDSEELLWRVLSQVYQDFLNGDLELIIAFVEQINDEAVRNGKEKIFDTESVRSRIKDLSSYLNSVHKFPTEVRDTLTEFFLAYEQFKSLRYIYIYIYMCVCAC